MTWKKQPNVRGRACLALAVAQLLIVATPGLAQVCVDSTVAPCSEFAMGNLTITGGSTDIFFIDTTSLPGGNDWAIEVNAGSDPFLAILDFTNASTQIARFDAGAPANSLRVDSDGDVGLKTAAPAQDIHIIDTFPAIRLEDSDDGQSWEVVGAGPFFIRDVTNGFADPFIIFQGAPQDSFRMVPNGDIGLGSSGPQASLHVQRDTTAKLLVENVSPAGAAELLELRSNGNPFFIFKDTSLARSYSFAMGATGHFIISNQQQPGVQYRFNPTGTLTLTNVVETSGRQFKENVVPLVADWAGGISGRASARV